MNLLHAAMCKLEIAEINPELTNVPHQTLTDSTDSDCDSTQ